MLLSSESTLFRFISQDEGCGSSVVIVTGLLCPSGNFHHWVNSKNADANLVLEFFAVRCLELSPDTDLRL